MDAGRIKKWDLTVGLLNQQTDLSAAQNDPFGTLLDHGFHNAKVLRLGGRAVMERRHTRRRLALAVAPARPHFRYNGKGTLSALLNRADHGPFV